MTTRVIWGEDDHETRARSLATAYFTTAQSIRTAPTTIAGLDKLVFWGHGTRDKFCMKTPDEFVELIGEWRRKNPSLEVVEMLTCNIRHVERKTDSFTDQVVTALSRRANRRADRVTFRALPKATAPNGVSCAYSILKWHPRSATWAYIAAPKKDKDNHWDGDMFDAVWGLEDFLAPRGTATDFPRAHAAFKAHKGPWTLKSPRAIQKKWDKEKLDIYNARHTHTKQNAYIRTGTLGLLRWMLEDIK